MGVGGGCLASLKDSGRESWVSAEEVLGDMFPNAVCQQMSRNYIKKLCALVYG